MSVHSDVFETFIKMKPDTVYTMKNSDHGANIHLPSPYHMEGDVWTHTCIAYQSLLSIDKFNSLCEHDQKLVCIAVLCHDLGKPFVRVTNQYDYCRFIGHEKKSVVEFISLSDLCHNFYELSMLDMYNIQIIISAHSEYWLAETMQNIVPLLNYRDDILDLYKIVVTADQMGQIKISDNGDTKKDIYAFNFNTNRPARSKHTSHVSIMVGPPACGKDSIIKLLRDSVQKKLAIVSYDDIRMAVYRNNNDCTDDTCSSVLYSKAWKWCNDQKLNLDNYMFNEIKEHISNGTDVVISNTSLTVKSRAKLISKLRSIDQDMKISVLYVFVDKYDAIERDIKRESVDKTVGKKVITSMFNNIEVPTYNEDIDEIVPIYNYNGAYLDFEF